MQLEQRTINSLQGRELDGGTEDESVKELMEERNNDSQVSEISLCD